MNRFKYVGLAIVALAFWGFAQSTPPATKDPAAVPAIARKTQSATSIARVIVGVNKSIVFDEAGGIRRIAVSNGEIADAVAVSPKEAMINGKTAGETSLILWLDDGSRKMFDLEVKSGSGGLEGIREEIKREFPAQDLRLSVHSGTVFLSGFAQDMASANRALEMASALGKVVNLLQVRVPDGQPQVLLRVRFANVDRGATSNLGFNLFSATNSKVMGATSTGQFGSQPTYDLSKTPATTAISDLLNIFLYRPDINLGAAISALEANQLAQILAEPNLMTISGHRASFLAGGQFPYPTLQGGGGGVGQITIQFRDFGIRLNFLPTVTLRGTIQLEVEPEVSSLDPANGLTVSGYTVPGLDVRRVHTEVELKNGQSLVIAGLLDNTLTETINKVPGLSKLPMFGKLFESRALLKNNSELLVIVTPEIIEPIPVGVPIPTLAMPKPFLDDAPFPVNLNPQAGAPGTAQGVDATPPPNFAASAASLPPSASTGAGHAKDPAMGSASPPLRTFLPFFVPVENLRRALSLEAGGAAPAPTSNGFGAEPPSGTPSMPASPFSTAPTAPAPVAAPPTGTHSTFSSQPSAPKP